MTYLLKKQDHTNTILYGVRNTSGLGQITIDFRENNTYKLGRHHFMSAEYYRGRFTIRDSIIYLDNPRYSELITSDKLLITKNPSFDSTKKQNILKALFGTPEDDATATTLLYQIDNSGQKLESAISFKVVDKTFN
ncbi:hypothetical protein FRZ67_18150 [Panacibacter ginsenosidivorans]|uniref:Uncharacterized protein n=1 Tax=Panacibacter ginsenosidivorans TaxID=1813871 RepID=A0A5B8VCV7_9BACT|nr:hypothetical protein [Panacibacter ginsenosidivorans]QEC69142.1 hypothetical protein FRZ67_18150 [Panacibacter ginsenosidivorans]